MCGVDGGRSHAAAGARHAREAFSRADTINFAWPPPARAFRAKYSSIRHPASNADVGMTLAHILGLKLSKKGDLIGRVLSESLKEGNHQTPQAKQLTRISRARKKRSANRYCVVCRAVGKSDVLRCGRLSRPDGGTGKTGGEQEAFSHGFDNRSSPKNGGPKDTGSRGMNVSAITRITRK